MATRTNDKSFSTVPLDWKEVYYTNQLPSRIRQQCRSGIGLDLRGVQEIGVKYGFLRSRRENNWYPHYIRASKHPLRRFAAVHVHADSRKTRLLRRTKAGPSGMSNYDHRIALTVDFS